MPPCDIVVLRWALPSSSSFNPCFSGCRPATLPVYYVPLALLSVSILVLVDAALRRSGAKFWGVVKQVSILVLVDAALRHDQDGYGSRAIKMWFQSLF